MSMKSQPPMFVPNDLLTEFLILLPVKSLLRFKCVSNSWNTLISDPNFVKFHLKKSKSRNPHFTLVTNHVKMIIGESPNGSNDECEYDFSIIPYPISSFLDNPSFSLFADHNYLLSEKDCLGIAGFCNGLICLTGYDLFRGTLKYQEYEYWLRLWNPATRAISEKFGTFQDFNCFNFNFGCEYSTGTYKVIASRYIRDQLTSEVRVFSDNVWRHIENFPVVPLHMCNADFEPGALFFNGTLNWLAIHNETPYIWYHKPHNITIKQFVILSLNLETDTYNQYILPQGFDEVPPAEPTVRVLGDCLCFSYPYQETYFIIWQMKNFGDEKSWTQFLKISYQDLQLDYDFCSETTLKYNLRCFPLFLSKDDNTLALYIINQDQEVQAILYNWREQRVEQTKVSVHKTIIDDGSTCSMIYWHLANSFVESLIPICWK